MGKDLARQLERAPEALGSVHPVAPGALDRPAFAPPPTLTADEERAIVAAHDAALSPSTRADYSGAWDRFVEWADRQGYDALPAAPETVAAYLATRAESGLSPASVRLDRAAIRAAHLAATLPTPTDHPAVARVTRGLTRTAAATRPAPQQAAGLTAEALAAVRATAHLPRTGPGGRTESADTATRRGAMDVAIASTMRDAMLRRSEAAALRWADVELLPDGTGRVAIRRSKTDQEGEGAVQFLGTGAAAAVAAIRPEAPEPTGRVFGVSGRTLARRIAAAAKAAGLHGAFSGHSGRVGMARDLVAAGASVAAVQVAGRWASADMPAKYARAELAARGAAAAYYRD